MGLFSEMRRLRPILPLLWPMIGCKFIFLNDRRRCGRLAISRSLELIDGKRGVSPRNTDVLLGVIFLEGVEGSVLLTKV